MTSNAVATEESCEQLKGLINRQKQVCRRNVEIMDSVKKGAGKAIEECQFQFTNRRWNCSTVDENSIFGNVLNQGKAFCYLLMSG